MSKIDFSSDITFKDFESFQWTIDSFYKIDFFDGIPAKVILLNEKSNIEEFILKISSPNDAIFLDIEYLNTSKSIAENNENNICRKNYLLAFCFKSTIYIFIIPAETELCNRMKAFLSLNNGSNFIGYNTEQIKEQLNDIFGSDFSININDMLKTCLSTNEGNFYEIITKYIKQPKIEINIDSHTIKCDIDNLIIPQVLIASLKTFSLSLLYPKFINPIDNKVKSASDQKNIQFSSKLTPDDLQFCCNIGESYNIEFFEGIFTPVHLIDANSDLTEYLQKISEDQTIYIDLKSVQTYVYNKKMTPEEQKEVPYICIFSFCCSSGVYLFKQLTLTANEQLKTFLSLAQKDHKIVGINLESAMNKLQHFFGPDFSVKIEDVSKSRLSPKTDPTNFHDLVVKYYKTPTAEFKNKNIKNALWHKNPLSMSLFIYAAFKVYSLSLCYPNFPLEKVEGEEIEVKKPIPLAPKKTVENSPTEVKIYSILSPSEVKSQPKIEKKGEIHFPKISDLAAFHKHDWLVGDSYDVEFFSGELNSVFLLDATSDISEYVMKMKSDCVVFFDLEYVMLCEDAPPICLFQFCCSSGAFLFKQSRIEVNDQMKKFLSFESGIKFVGKGIHGDIQRLKQFFGNDFEINLEDVEQTRLYSYEETANFDDMVLKFAGQPEMNFKDKKVSRSNWNATNLSMKQVLYAAFDVVSLCKCFPSFPPIRAIKYNSPSDTIMIDVKKKFEEFVKKKQKSELSDNEIDSMWNSNPNLVAKMLEIDLNVLDVVVHDSMRVTTGHKFSCRLCNRSVKCSYFINLINHYMKYHYGEDERATCSSNDRKIDFKKVFLDYLFNSGRIILGNNSCILCDKVFGSTMDLENHCWNSHFELLNEFLKIKKIPNNNNMTEKENNENSNDGL